MVQVMEHKQRFRIYIGISIIFLLGLFAGSFFDLPVAKALYIENFIPARVISFVVAFAFFESCVFFIGVLFRHLLVMMESRAKKMVITVIFIYLFISTVTLAGGEILNDPLFGNLFSGAAGSFGYSFLAGLIVCCPVFLAGILINREEYRKENIRVLIKLIFIMTMAFLLTKYFNCMIIRPHYWLTLQNNGTDVYTDWYHAGNRGRFLMSLKDLITSHPGSFTSSHGAFAALFLVVLPSYSIVFPKLRDKERLLMLIAGILILPVIFCRLISGENYLSDVCLGAWAGMKLCISFNGVKKKKTSRLKSLFKGAR